MQHDRLGIGVRGERGACPAAGNPRQYLAQPLIIGAVQQA